MGTVEELRSTETWSNLLPQILKAGRCTHLEPEGADEDDIAAKKEALESSDPQVDRFRTINEHSTIVQKGKKGEPDKAWVAKVAGDTQLYKLDKGEDAPKSYATLVLKSLRWPGAVTVSKGGKFTSIYVGYGMKKGGTSFEPSEPPMVEKDPEEPVDQPEPQGKEKVEAAAEEKGSQEGSDAE